MTIHNPAMTALLTLTSTKANDEVAETVNVYATSQYMVNDMLLSSDEQMLSAVDAGLYEEALASTALDAEALEEWVLDNLCYD